MKQTKKNIPKRYNSSPPNPELTINQLFPVFNLASANGLAPLFTQASAGASLNYLYLFIYLRPLLLSNTNEVYTE